MTARRSCRPFPLRSSIAISISIVAVIEGISSSGVVDLRPYFAGLPATVAAIIVCASGVAALLILQRRYSFCAIGTNIGARSLSTAVAAAIPFMAAVTLADVGLGFPPNIHVQLPFALAFYPAMGLIAQFALHIVPFTLLLWAFTQLSTSWPLRRQIWLAIVLSAAIEAAFQLGGAAAPGDGLTLLSALVAAQLFAFGLVELYLYMRFDFVSMYVFRLAYYSYWHVLLPNVLQSAS